MKKIISVQDISCFGSCSLTVALPILSAYGIETAILPSAILSTHTGGFNQGFTCLDLTQEMPGIVRHWMREGLSFDAVYTGYISDVRQFDLISEMRGLLNPAGLLIVDPAMADHGKLYKALSPEIVQGMRKLCRKADVILPNLTEAAFLLGREYRTDYSREEILEMAESLAAMGPKVVILTGVGQCEKIGAAAYERESGKISEFYTRRMEKNFHGTGDTFASVAVAGILNGLSMEKVLEEACGFVVRCIEKTMGDETHGYGVKFQEVLAEDRNR